MPKRQNPFTESNSHGQIKTHVGEKEVNMGVSFQTKMKAVYERTMALLFEGQRRTMSTVTATSMRDTAPSPEKPESCPAVDNLPEWAHDQYTLDKQGHLSTQQPVIAGPSNTVAPPPRQTASGCPSCKAGAVSFNGSCSFCDTQICSQCCRECLACQRIFCSLCSVINYDETFERSFCLSCS